MKTSNMIKNCDKFKALVPIVTETEYFVEGRYNNPRFYLFSYDKSKKEISIHYIRIHKQYVDKDWKLKVWADWSTNTYKSEKSALNALSTCLKNIKEFYNLLRISKANEDF